MSEYFRTAHYCAVDTEAAMVLDRLTGKCDRFGPRNDAIGTFDEALTYLSHAAEWSVGRLVIVKLDVVALLPLEAKSPAK